MKKTQDQPAAVGASRRRTETKQARQEPAGAKRRTGGNPARKRTATALQHAHSLLVAALESTADGILVVDTAGKVTGSNRRFAELWQIPETLMATRDDEQLLKFAVDQLVDPKAFLDKVQTLYDTPEASSFDEVAFKDGRIFERYSQPQRIGDSAIGRVWSFRDVTERKRAAEQVARTAREWQATFDATNDAIWILDAGHQVLRSNKTAERFFKRPSCDMLGQQCWAIVHDTTGPHPDCPFVRARQSGHREMMELQDGERWFEVTVDPILDGAGQNAGAVHIVSDITERKRTEKALRESESRYRVLFEQSPDAILIMDPETTLPVEFNDEACRHLGYSREEFARLRIADYEADQSPTEIQETMASSLAKGSAAFEVRHRTKQGELRNTWVSVQTLQIEGRTLCYSIWHDITARKRAAEQLLRQAALLDAANESICVRSLDHTVTYWNAGAERLFGWTSAEALGRNAIEIAQSETEAFTVAHAALLDEGTWSGELKVTTKTGKEAIVFCHWTLLRDEQHRPKEVLAISVDVTEKKQLEAHLRQAERMDALGTLAGGIAHDFNNILGAIIGNVELAQQDVGAGHPAAESLNEIRKASQRGKDLVQHILAFGRRQQLPRYVIALQQVVEEAITLLHATIPADVEMVATFDVDAPMVLADATQIHQVLINLCTNAWQAMEGRAGRIDIRLDGVTLDTEVARVDAALRPGHFARLCVSDTGCGIDAATLERIFEPFFTTKPVGKGTGLGLSAVHGIMKVHGGAIAVASQPGEGTTFTLYFPAAGAEASIYQPDLVEELREVGQRLTDK